MDNKAPEVNEGYTIIKSAYAGGKRIVLGHNPSSALSKTLKQINMPHIRFHDLRHSCASMLILRGWSMKDISEWLGHADIGTTMNIYGHINMEHKRELGKDLEGVF